ncbi:MAG: hypothetical protein WAM70_20875 [Pyrinomonadaceae bacterium]
MTSQEKATALDAQERPVEAAEAYESVIVKSDADLDTYLNLAVLYFVCNDGGYSAHHKLSEPFLDQAWNRTSELITEAAERFGENAELKFWRRYFDFILRGADPFYPECELLVEEGTTLVPYFHLFAGPDGGKYRDQAEKLLTSVNSGSTEKERYIKSVLEGTFKRQRFARLS